MILAVGRKTEGPPEPAAQCQSERLRVPLGGPSVDLRATFVAQPPGKKQHAAVGRLTPALKVTLNPLTKKCTRGKPATADRSGRGFLLRGRSHAGGL